ncbi:MAG: DUF2171 domain-containing protein [Solirubrobacterales bacterium]|nr:DUF2171 domain-containing protein [Solirubrobacterales bacterium]
MSDLGDPIAYEALERHTPVLSADGQEIGTVDHVLADEREDVFDGIVIRRTLGHRHTHAFADADQIAAIHEHGVTLKLGTTASEALPAPSDNPAVMREDPAQKPYSALERKLLRAWDWVSGNY